MGASLAGVLHAAGALFDASLGRQTPSVVRAVFAPKAACLDRLNEVKLEHQLQIWSTQEKDINGRIAILQEGPGDSWLSRMLQSNWRVNPCTKLVAYSHG